MIELTGKSLDEQTVPATFRVVIEPVPSREDGANGWVLSLTVQREQETLSRRIEGEDCASVTRAAASALALILGPSTEEAPTEAAQDPDPPPEAEATAPHGRPAKPAPSPAKTKSESAAPEPEAPESWTWGARLGGGVDANLLPEPTGLAQGALHGARSGLRYELLGTLLPARKYAFATGTANLSLVAGGARVCRDTGGAAWMFMPCLDLEVGRLDATGEATSSRSSALWLAAGATFLGGYRLSRDYSLVLEVPIRVTFERHRVRVGGTVVHELPPIDVRTILGFEATWP